MSRRRGFSLLEAVFTLFIVFLILGVALDMFNKYCSAVNFSTAKSNSLSTMQVAVQTILDDARQATLIETPSVLGGPGSNEIKLLKVDPTRLNHYGRPRDTIEVRYYLSTGVNYPVTSLLRDTTPVNGTTTTTEVAKSVAGFNVVGLASWPLQPAGGPNAVRVRISLLESARVLVITGDSLRPPF